MKTNKRIGKHHSVWIFSIASIGCGLLALFFSQKILAMDNETIMRKIGDVPNSNTAIKTVNTTPNNNGDDNKGSTAINNLEDLTPEFKFSFKNGGKLTGKKEISGEVSGAEEIEFYVVKGRSLDPKIYLGKAKKSGNKWKINYDFSQLPNGDYRILAKIKNIYGAYMSDAAEITVANATNEEEKNTNKNEEKGKEIADNNANINTAPETATPTESNNEEKGKEIADNNANINTAPETATPTESNNESNNEEATVTEKKVETKKSIGKEMNKLIQQEKTISQSNISEQEKDIHLQEIKKQKKLLKKEFISRQEAERLLKKGKSELTPEEKARWERIKSQIQSDSDGDGLPDYEEERLGTNPFSADSDSDGFLDGDEAQGGFNPLKYSPGNKSDKIVFEEPINSGKENDFYEITNVAYVKPPKEQTTEKEQTQEKFAISGYSLPNSFVTLYIYSSPIVVTVKADENGSWTYLLDKELEDGKHKVYAAITDNTGKITAKSKPFVFIKTAKAISSLNKINQKQLDTQLASPIKKERANLIKFVVLVSLISLGLAIVSIGLFVKHSFKHRDLI